MALRCYFVDEASADTIRDRVLVLRSQDPSVSEIAQALGAEGQPVSAQTVWAIPPSPSSAPFWAPLATRGTKVLLAFHSLSSTPTAMPARHAGRWRSAIGDRVIAGQYVFDSASTGNSTGPHLHFSIEAGETGRCPPDLS